MTQLVELQEALPKFEAAGIKLYAVSYDEPAALAQWARVATAQNDLLDGKQMVIQKALSGGRSFYRLRVAGFVGLDDSRRFCSALLARHTPCIPVTAR